MYPEIPIKKLNGKELFKNTGGKEISIYDFWQYGFSDIYTNIIRGIVAEFIVENALREPNEIRCRNSWGDCDIILDDGTKIEVKCSSFLQAWPQNILSVPTFTGLKAKSLYWSDAVKKFVQDEEPDYKADIYVFALINQKDQDRLDLLDLGQWCFYVLTKERLREITKDGSSISLTKLRKDKVKSVQFIDLRSEITKLITSL